MKIKSFILLFWMVLATFTNSNSQTCSDCRFITPVFDSVTVSTVKFGEGKNVDGNNQELYMDIYQPFGDTMTNRPVAIFAFGGAFVQGARDDWYVVEVCKLLAKAGYVAVSPDYRYGIDYSEIIQLRYMRIFFRPVQDMRACIQYLKADFSELGNNYNIDTNKIILGGASAGAISALMTSYCDKPSEMLQSGSPTALDALGGFYSTTGIYPNYGWGHAAVLNIAGALLDADWIEPGDVPHIAAHGDSDQVVPYGVGSFGPLTAGLFNLEGSYIVDSMAKAKGVCSYLYTMEGKDHPSEDLGMPYIMSVVSRLMLRMHAVINNRSFCCPLNIETDPGDTARYNAAYPEVTMNAQITNDNGNAQMRWCSFPCNTTSTSLSLSFTPDTNWQFMTSYVYEGNCQDVSFTILKSDSMYSSVKSYKELSENLFTIYPHPVSGNFVIALKNNTTEKIKVEMADLAGRMVYRIETTPQNNNIFISAENILPGSYILKLSSEKEQWQPRKLIIAH
jgi:acetyl esterase/lipase